MSHVLGDALDVMTPLKAKGDLAELMVAADLLRRGYKIAIPYGEDWDYDLILCRDGQLERVQVKYTCSDGVVIEVRCYSQSLTNGKVLSKKCYTAEMVDWIAVYDVTTARAYYIPAAELGIGRFHMSLRIKATKNNQQLGVRRAEEYLEI